MSDEPKPTIMQRIKSWFDLSLAAMAAIVVGIVLLSIAAIAWLIYSVDPNRIAWGDYLTIPRAAGLFALWTLSCITTYFGVRVWMNDVPTGDRRIREGWNAGMLLLSKHGVKLSDLPCFVVLGCATRHEQDLLVGAEGFSTPHQSSSSAPAIDWHLSKDRILIFCRDIGVFAGLLHGGDSSTAPSPGKLAKQSTQNSESAVSDPPSDSSPDAERDLKSIESDTKSEADVNEEEIAGNELLTGNTTATLTTATLTTATPVTASVRKNTDADQKMATITSALTNLDRANALVRDAQTLTVLSPARQPIPESLPHSLTSTKATVYQNLLSQLCDRLRAARFPHSPVNGTLVLVDSKVLAGGPESARVVGRAIRSDLDQLRMETGVMCPVTMLISENEHGDDYAELSRRLQSSDQGSNVALGTDFESEEIPTVDAMNRLASNCVQQIESRVNQLFRTPRSLAQPQNHRLVRVLIRCRRMRSALMSLMVESCASDSTETIKGKSDTPIVSGLYVASPGTSPLAQGLVRSALARMVDQQNHLAWTIEEQQRWSRHRSAIVALIAFIFLLAVALIVQLWIAVQR